MGGRPNPRQTSCEGCLAILKRHVSGVCPEHYRRGRAGRPRDWPGVGGFLAMSQRFSRAKTIQLSSVMAAVIVVAIVAAGCSSGAASRPPTPTPSQIPTPAPTQMVAATATLTPEATPLIDPTVAAAVDQLLFGSDGVYGVVLMKPDGTVVYSRHARTPFIAASLYKLVLIVEIYAQRERGDLDFDDKVVLEEEYFPLWDEVPDPYFPLTYIHSDVTIEEALFATG